MNIQNNLFLIGIQQNKKKHLNIYIIIILVVYENITNYFKILLTPYI